MSALLEVHEHNDSTYYTGPLNAGVALAAETVAFSFETIPVEGRGPRFLVYLYASALDDRDDWIAYGSGWSTEEAMRYALGTEFGPLDDQYDEAALREALAKHE